jgi:MFS family permease
MWLSARWGGAFTPLLVGYLLSSGVDYQWAFLSFALLGLVWTAFFYASFRDRPDEHPGVSRAELQHINGNIQAAGEQHSMPWRKMFFSKRVCKICSNSALRSLLSLLWLIDFIISNLNCKVNKMQLVLQ